MIVLDTTVLVYALGADHELQIPARRLVDAIGDGIVKAATTIEVIQEFVHVRSRRRSRREAADSALGYAALLAPLVRPNEADLQRALGLYADHPRLGAFDAVLIMVMLVGALVVGPLIEVLGPRPATVAFAVVTPPRSQWPPTRVWTIRTSSTTTLSRPWSSGRRA